MAKPGRDRASGTGGQPGGIGLSGLGQRCGERIARVDLPAQAPPTARSVVREANKYLTFSKIPLF